MYKLTPAVYIWSHGYLNTMQVGIQSAHVVAELLSNYPEENSDSMDWANNHKVLRLLNGGTGEMFNNNLREFLALCSRNIDHTFFREPDIGNMVTAFGMVLDPNTILAIEEERLELKFLGYKEDEIDSKIAIVEFLSRCRSAS